MCAIPESVGKNTKKGSRDGFPFLITYIVGGAVLGVVFGLLAKIPLIGILFGIVGWAVGVYCFVGIVLSVLDYFNLIK